MLGLAFSVRLRRYTRERGLIRTPQGSLRNGFMILIGKIKEPMEVYVNMERDSAPLEIMGHNVALSHNFTCFN